MSILLTFFLNVVHLKLFGTTKGIENEKTKITKTKDIT